VTRAETRAVNPVVAFSGRCSVAPFPGKGNVGPVGAAGFGRRALVTVSLHTTGGASGLGLSSATSIDPLPPPATETPPC
jgi:hypothetical protein